ncbi:hypothetical protein [Microbacterium album]|uniref:PBP domain-containing protein n=1 Tax=Microbacterium album TaxID=2053191 RepID=A0A917MNB6_9MICO|nr:hypothetical protein [Microbacterium album]GGH51306.1 hypothetical protein GCM10010921_30650 [Microbacterium album]
MTASVVRIPRTGLRRWTALLAAAAVAAGLVSLSHPAPAAQATEATDSAVTVKWAGGNAPDLQRYQPDHAALTSDGAGAGGDAGSGHWNDFKDLEVTVSQTRGLRDQAVTVTAKGLAPTVRTTGQGVRNYLHVFQCWGPDPLADDFAQTCQWGGYSNKEVGGSIPPTIRNLFGDDSNSIIGRGGVPFRAVTGDVSAPEQIYPGGPGTSGFPTQGIQHFFTASTSNERPFVPVAADGTARTNFVVQSGAAQPYLGCGDRRSAAGERCWLVVVPRGSHSGALPDGPVCGRPLPDNSYGRQTTIQIGEPLSPDCSFWDNRVVVPLDFDDPYLSCPPGSAERGVVGSELVSDALSSWQPRLCAGADGAAFNLTTNTGNLARAQLLTGQTGMVAVSRPLTERTIGPTDPSLLAQADVRYAPLANTALVIGFVAESQQGTVYSDVRLTPRLIAKLLTQSYRGNVPYINASWNAANRVSESFAALRLDHLVDDEEWGALGNPPAPRGPGEGVDRGENAWVVVGPHGDDAIAQLWEYVLADADAVAFLRGEPDPWGNTVNRYYLPPDHDDAAGGGYDLLSAPPDAFPKIDQSLVPTAATAATDYRGMQIDSTSFHPYSASFQANAVRIANVDRRMTNRWDKDSLAGWTAEPPLLPLLTGRLLLGPVTASAAEHFGLHAAQLALPLEETTTAETVRTAREFVPYSDGTVAAAVAAATVDPDTGMAVPDAASLPPGAYPLATTLYAAVDLNSPRLDAPARADYALLLDYAAGQGNVRATARGGLPDGYVPLTETQTAAARQLAAALRGEGGDPDDDGGPNEGGGRPAPHEGAGGVDGPAGSGGPGARGAGLSESAAAELQQSQTSVSAADAVDAVPTAAVSSPAARAVGAAMLAAAAALVASPFLLRRRDAGG